MAQLTVETLKRVDFLFKEEERRKVYKLLVEECGNNLPFLEKCTPEELERFRFAALKESNGNWEKLVRAVELAKLDWRDLLVSAGFANDVSAHKNWIPRKRDKKMP